MRLYDLWSVLLVNNLQRQRLDELGLLPQRPAGWWVSAGALQQLWYAAVSRLSIRLMYWYVGSDLMCVVYKRSAVCFLRWYVDRPGATRMRP